METPTRKCIKCGRMTDRITKGMCFNCYRRFAWNRKLIECKRCKRQKPNHAKGYCAGCYNYVFHLEKTKAGNYKKWYNIDLETYRKITEKCLICGFSKVVDLHHLDHNHENNSEDNFIGLCPNHHKMLHDFQYREEVLSKIQEKLDEKSPSVIEETPETKEENSSE